MIRKYIVVLIAVLLIISPARAFTVEQDNTFEDGTYYGEPVQEQAPYDNTYQEPGYGENYQNDGYQNNGTEEGAWNNGVNGTEDNTYNNGYNNQYEEPAVNNEGTYTEPYTEPYTDPGMETYEESYTEPEVYTEPYTEPVAEPEPEVESEPETEAEEPAEEERLSINTVKGEGYTVSGTVTDGENPAAEVTLVLAAGEESIEAVSDENGEFTFTDVANGIYTLGPADSDIFEAAAEPVEVAVENRNKLGYEIGVTPVEAEPEEESAEETADPAEETKEEPEEELPVEAAETDERSTDASGGISTFELLLISGGTLLLIAAIGIALFRKLSAR
ncbi:hypothetical protein GCM10007275_17160 [Jeotgalicoccus coquinae]|uniref:Uncharacterized protein YxeA n=1 Tax=Jeotgalicoccus coquinae TaxID=709509 RepID=A0A6V7R0R4_9STAP|nr:carboxypeptidase-like regulatory domain-containing protein [Jeotgalicoccus coquinae]MBB6423795.1 uncharacterized protein YxeA [Jeotgalicoccus coquinae]GGE22624.1 hypothetical protein GCM10007275_17160 [Jeotgalicoccus coquinae]CAD2070623.1 hypothetical protein JEOCOQ751_00012 [Jeotgalicoccus coquinae]